MRTRPPSTPRFSGCPITTASWLGWAPTARSSPTTSAESPSGQAISRAAPFSSPGSGKRRGGAGTNAQVPRIRPHQGRFHRRRADHPRDRHRAAARAACCPGPPSLRYQALFTEAGGLAAGNDVTVSGIKVGSVNSIELAERRCAGRFHDRRQVRARFGHHRAHPHRNPARRAGAGAGVRRQRHVVAEPGHPDHRTSSPYSLTDAVSELTANTAGTDTDTLNQSLDTLGPDARPDRSAAGADVRRPVAGVANRSTAATTAWPSC